MIVMALRVLLLQDADVAQALGAAQSARLWARQAPQAAGRPFGVLTRVSRVGLETLDGPTGFAASRVQLDLYAETEAALASLADASRRALQGVAHQTVAVGAESPPATVRVQALRLVNEFDMPEEAGLPRLFRRVQDWQASWSEQAESA